jgi:hypothetical protein
MAPPLSNSTYLIDLPLLIVLISLVYSATRYEKWGSILRETVRWIARLTVFLGLIGGVLFLVSLGYFWTLLVLFIVGVAVWVVFIVAGHYPRHAA